ncbi:MAG: UV DNA damage repair endonuclease UvsE [Promethearchaeia archaeon]
MKIGYPCINPSLECRSSRTFRLKNYSRERVISTIRGNLECLRKILRFNAEHNMMFFRITSDLIPFASHEVMDVSWQDIFKPEFEQIGSFIKEHKMRITMHPGQYTVLNSNRKEVFLKSLKDIEYHVQVLDLMDLDSAAKVQVHVGGVYGNKSKSKQRFIDRYFAYESHIKNRLVIENDDKSYNLKNCLDIHQQTGIPVIFDIYHHKCNSSGESVKKAFERFSGTWKERDGIPIVHYSDEHPTKGKPSHSEHMNIENFKEFTKKTIDFDFDLMLEIKDKEKSAFKVIDILSEDPRIIKN